MSEQTAGNVPQIRFKGFEWDWDAKTLGMLGRVAMNKRIFKHQTSETGDIPFYKIGTFGKQPDAFISRKLFEEYKSKFTYPNKEDLLISASGSIGRIVEYSGKDEYFQDSNIVWLQHNGTVVNAFLKQFYSFVEWAGLEGSTIKRLYNKNILETRIVLPKKAEQTKIGTYFRELDQLIDLHQRKHDKLLTLKKAMLQKMFPQAGATTPEIRFGGFTGDWIEKRLDEISEIVGGGTPSTSIQEYWGGDIDWYSPTEIGDDVYAIGSVKKITSLGFTKSSARLLPPFKTVLFTSRAGIGGMAILMKEGCTNQGFQSIVLDDDTDPYFIYSMGHLIKIHALKHASGSTFLEVSSTQLGKMIIRTPEKDEQQKIGSYFRTLDELISKHAIQLQKLKQIKSACLEKMFV